MSGTTTESEQIDIDEYIDEIFESVEHAPSARSELRGILRALVGEGKASGVRVNARVSCFAVIDGNARGGESIDSIWLDEEKAKARKVEIKAYRIEKHEVNT